MIADAKPLRDTLCRMNENIEQRLANLEAKLDATWQSVEKTRKMLLVILWGSAAAVALPLIIGAFIVPAVINSYLSAYQGLL